ncbi:molybdenum ABC transporter ATP-binding protein [Aestuariibius insulae]|uniref:molybdenum ABC transporter ATP-binding protein n=1 Tax=Aestuariibius insulae TaxID=2058287 RepID=UPI00345E4855
MTLSVCITHDFGAAQLDLGFEAPGGVTALYGPSGAGKTSVVNAVAGLLKPDAGRIALGGDVLVDTEAGVFVPVHKRRMGYVFQDGRLFPHLTVARNLAYGRSGASPDKVVDLLDLGGLLTRYPARLSGGEKQRVAIGRALLSDPRMLLMDEPLASLDPGRKAEILPYLDRLVAETKLPVIYVSHAAEEVLRLATTLVLIEGGRVLEAGPVAEMAGHPAIAGAVPEAPVGTVIEGVIGAKQADGLTEVTAAGGRLYLSDAPGTPGERVALGIGAEEITLAAELPAALGALNVLDVTVDAMRLSGQTVTIGLRAGPDRLTARLARRAALQLELRPGQRLKAIVRPVLRG